jgi:Rad3-related DNA helicase
MDTNDETLNIFRFTTITKEDIVAAMKDAFLQSPEIRKSDILKKCIYFVLVALCIDDYRYIIIEAPTGTGKTIIGFLLSKCWTNLTWLEQERCGVPKASIKDNNTYYLTSSKALQEQIDNDLTRFRFYPEMAMLKGTANYVCSYLRAQWSEGFPKTYMYSDRPCVGDKTNRYGCEGECPYRVARSVAAGAQMAVLNYHYFLTVMSGAELGVESEYRFFNTRSLTLCDEAHLIPDIVCDLFNLKLSMFITSRVRKFASMVLDVDYSKKLVEYCSKIETIFKLSSLPPEKLEFFLREMKCLMGMINNPPKTGEFSSENDNIGTSYLIHQRIAEFINSYSKNVSLCTNLLKRREDLFIETQLISKVGGVDYYAHVVRDLSETAVVREHFTSKLDRAVFMSATIGSSKEFIQLFGLDQSKTMAFSIPSTFDFSRSPIYMTKSGYLNYSNFSNNIDKCLRDVLKITEGRHQMDKGMIHTVTKDIANLLKSYIQTNAANPQRYLFYNTSDEKEACIKQLKEVEGNWVIVGFSLYEGLDLYDDQGRFNIMIKVPYTALTDYIKKKMERCSFWYDRVTSEKIIQAVGRTNRHVKDYSATYLIDSCFPEFVRKKIHNPIITSRLKSIKI